MTAIGRPGPAVELRIPKLRKAATSRASLEPRFQYRHVWRQGDVVIWDNRCTMHKANADYPEGERRLMHRVVVAGTAPV